MSSYPDTTDCRLRMPAEHRLPRDDLLGDAVKSAKLAFDEERFFVTLMGARPKGHYANASS